jgi:hypothetical protein
LRQAIGNLDRRSRSETIVRRPAVGERNRADDVPLLDLGEMSAKSNLGTFHRELTTRSADLADKLPDLSQVSFAARRCNEASARRQHSPQLRERSIEVGRAVEARVGKRQVYDIAADRSTPRTAVSSTMRSD